MASKKEVHKATCADCGKECEVPFKPDGTSPVYCRECYAKRSSPRKENLTKERFGTRS